MVVVNVEQTEFDQPVARPLSPQRVGGEHLPDVPNFSWFEYGLRIGFWRLLAATDRLDVPVTMALNGSVCDSYPQVVHKALMSGWDVVGHGYYQRPLPEEEDERGAVWRALEAIEGATGTRPIGWLGPGLSETNQTLEILVDAGVEFVLDWVNDDQPYELKVAQGRLLSVPYSNEMNDIGVYIRLGLPGPSMLERVHDHLSTLLNDQPPTARVMPIAVHPFVIGQPHRFPYFVKILELIKNTPGAVPMTATQIYRWYRDVT
jgi:peptidoglycan/xylan/chitin deacetylase (PgdA/CDA1 family)